jgi:tetratricopeptide (TPR) repeat protein/CheY-like chemotaxis protein
MAAIVDTSLLLQRRLTGLDYTLDGIDRALGVDSSQLRKHLVHALVQDQSGLDDEAMRSVDAALRLDARNPLGLALKADWLGRENQLEKARKLLADPNLRGPAEWFAESTLGAVLWANGDLDEARTHLDTATEGSPQHALPYARLGEANRLRNEFPDALASFERAKKFAPRSAYIEERLADVYRMLGMLPDGLKALERAEKLEGLTSFGWTTRADILRQRGELDDAAKAFDEAIGLDASNPFPIAWRADVHLSQGRSDEALEGIESALALDPELWFGWGIRGMILRDFNRFREAGESFAKALALAPEPDNSWLLYWSGVLHLETGDHEASISELRTALLGQPDDQLIHRVLARALLETGKSDEALAEAQAAVAIDSTEPWTLSALGDAYAAIGRRKEAEKAWKSSKDQLKKGPPGPEDAWLEGWNLLHLERYDEALSALLDQLARKPDETGLDLDFALATLCSGRHEAALAEYYRAVAGGHQREENGRLKGLLHAARFDLQMSIPYHRIRDSRQVAQIKELLETGTEGEQAVEALWVDDKPANNVTEMQVIGDILGVRFETATDTSGAIAKLKADPDRYAFVITDMGRALDRRAGFTLLRKMRDIGIDLPTIIYAASSSAERDAEARRHGALAMTNSPSRLLELVSTIVRDPSSPSGGAGATKAMS